MPYLHIFDLTDLLLIYNGFQFCVFMCVCLCMHMCVSVSERLSYVFSLVIFSFIVCLILFLLFLPICFLIREKKINMDLGGQMERILKELGEEKL